MQRKYMTFSQGTFKGHLACTSIATVFAAAIADNDKVRAFNFDDDERTKFLTQFACGLWRESFDKDTHDESVEDVVQKHSFFKSGVVYRTDGWAGRYGTNSDDRRIPLADLIVEIEKTYKSKGSIGVVFTDNVVSFACGIASGNWYLYDSHAPAACCMCLPAASATLENISDMIVDHFIRKNGIFDATTFVRNDG